MNRSASFPATLVRIVSILMVCAMVAACGGGPNSKSAGDVIDDGVIATKVRTALAKDKTVSVFDISVEVFKGVVQLSGFVDSRDQAQRAVDLAADVRGVVDVKDRIDIK